MGGRNPRTRLGQWSVELAGLFIAFFLVFVLFVSLGQRGGETFFSNPLLTVPMLLAALSAILGFFTGIVGIVRDRERSILTFISTGIGLFVGLFSLAEVLLPH